MPEIIKGPMYCPDCLGYDPDNPKPLNYFSNGDATCNYCPYVYKSGTAWVITGKDIDDFEKQITAMHQDMKSRQEFLMQFFRFNHLPDHLQEVSKHFSNLAQVIILLPANPERTVALRKLLEAKDCAVRAKLAGES